MYGVGSIAAQRCSQPAPTPTLEARQLGDHVRMELWVGFDAEQFTERARAFVEARIERNVLATVLGAVRAGRYAEAIFAVVSDDRQEIVAAVVRTPPHLMLAAGEITDPDAFMQAWLAIDPACPGVSAEPELARPLSQACYARVSDWEEYRFLPFA